MKMNAATIEAYDEYQFYIEAVRVLDDAYEAANPRNFKTQDESEYYGEFIGECVMERALGGGDNPRNDAERIWRATMATRALNSFARNAPLHAEACRYLINSMYI